MVSYKDYSFVERNDLFEAYTVFRIYSDGLEVAFTGYETPRRFLPCENYSTYQEVADTHGNVNCIGCENCSNCINCVDCKHCSYCTYCIECEHLFTASHCNRCKSCRYSYNCSFCTEVQYSNKCLSAHTSTRMYHCYDCRGCNDCDNCNHCGNCSFCSYECDTNNIKNRKFGVLRW